MLHILKAIISLDLQAIGRPVMPPYWSLGFQLCRYGYNSLDRVKEVVAGMRQYDIPLVGITSGNFEYLICLIVFVHKTM